MWGLVAFLISLFFTTKPPLLINESSHISYTYTDVGGNHHQAYFPKFSVTNALQCHRFFNQSITDFNRVIVSAEFSLSTTCDAIKRRHYFPTLPFNKFEAEFPIAYARNVYTVRMNTHFKNIHVMCFRIIFY